MNVSIAKFTSSIMSVFEPAPSRAGRLTSRGESHKVELLKTSAPPMKSDDSQNPWYKDPMTVSGISAVALLALYAAYSCYSNGNGAGCGYSGYNGTYGGQEERETTCPADFSSFSGNPFAPEATSPRDNAFGIGAELPPPTPQTHQDETPEPDPLDGDYFINLSKELSEKTKGLKVENKQ